MVLEIVIPFLNEERHLPRLLSSLFAQSRPADRITLVDNGSTDRSAEIVGAFAAQHANVRMLRRTERSATRDRLARASEFRAFTWAVEQIEEPWDVVAKLDADLELPGDALDELLHKLEAEPALGLVGTYLSEPGPDGTLRRLRIAHDHVHGATKFYRRACWEAISPIPPILGWDTIDEVTARLHGWETRSIALSTGDPLHLRPRGEHDGRLRAYRRWGECAWGIGESPVHIVLWSLRQSRKRPRAIGALNYFIGWAFAGLRRRPRADPPVRARVRREQLQRIAARLRRSPGGRLQARPQRTPGIPEDGADERRL